MNRSTLHLFAVLTAAMLLLASCVITVGGSGRDPVKTRDIPPSYRTRFEAAEGVRSLSERDEIYEVIAKDAVESDKDAIARVAIDRIRSTSSRDRVAQECAYTVLAEGDSESAKRFADLMKSNNDRDEVLTAIATGAGAGAEPREE